MKTIYFIRRRDGIGPVKIGCTKWPPERLYFMQMWSPYKLEVVATCPGEFADERCVHRAFAPFRMEGEWFASVPALVQLIEEIAVTGELPPHLRAPRPVTGFATPANPYREQILERVRAGETYQRIASDFGLSRQRVHQMAARAGCTKRARRRAVA